MRAALLGLALTVVLGLGFHLTLRQDQNLIQEKNRGIVTAKALAVVAQLESTLNSDSFIANGLAALVVAAPDLSSSSIKTALQVVHSTSPNLRNIALAPANRISYIYPLAGNEKALGLYYPDLPSQWHKVKEAMDRRSTVLAGPIQLRQGGNGLVSRTPVYMPNGDYWGMLSLVIDSDALLDRAQKTARNLGLVISLRGRDGMGDQGDVFFGASELFDSNSALITVHVPGGTWQLAARRLDPTQAPTTRYQQWQLVGWVGCFLVGILFFLYLRGRQRVSSSERQFRTILETSPDGVIVIDGLGLIEVFNPGAEAMFGYRAHEVIGQPVILLMNSDDARNHDAYVARAQTGLAHDMARGREIQGRRKDGSAFPIEVKVKGVAIDGQLVHVGILRDITERHEAQQKLLEMATQDALTGVANRRSLIEFLQENFALSVRYRRSLSVLMIDADHFKSINDQHGHPAGDQVLIHLAKLALECLRKTDKFGRMGGEEFLVVLPETEPEQAQQLAARLLHTIASTTVSIGAHEPIRFTVSIGIASLADDCGSAEDLLKRADVALYQAKERGRNRYFMG